MKVCPKCNTEYTDEKKFCKKDGQSLVTKVDEKPKIENEITTKKVKEEHKVEVDDVIKLLRLADESIASENLYEAQMFVERIIAIEPENKVAWIRKATILTKLENEEASIDAWRKVHEIAPENLTARLYVGVEACKAGEYSEAVDLLEKVVKSSKNDNERNDAMFFYAYSLIKVAEKDSRLPSIMNHLNLTSFRDTDDVFQKNILEELLLFQGNYFAELKKYEAAIENFETAYGICKNEKYLTLSADAFYKMARIDFASGQFYNSKKLVEKALEYCPNNEEYQKLNKDIVAIKKRKRKKIITWIIIAFVTVIIGGGAFWGTKYFIEKGSWDDAKNINTVTSFHAYLDKYPEGRYVDEAKQLIKKAEAQVVDTIAAEILLNLHFTKKAKITSTSGIESVLKVIGENENILPQSSGVNSFIVENKKLSNDFTCSIRYFFNRDIKDPVKTVTGTNWYGEPVYGVTGYKTSAEALFAKQEIEVTIDSKFINRQEDIINAISGKIEKEGYINYSDNQKDETLKCLATDKFIVVIKRNTDLVLDISYYNTNIDNFNTLLQEIKTGY